MPPAAMAHYDEIEIEDMDWNEELNAFTYSCPCGDLFQITMEELSRGEDIAHCPSCSLTIVVIYNQEDFQDEASQPAADAASPQPIAAVA